MSSDQPSPRRHTGLTPPTNCTRTARTRGTTARRCLLLPLLPGRRCHTSAFHPAAAFLSSVSAHHQHHQQLRRRFLCASASAIVAASLPSSFPSRKGSGSSMTAPSTSSTSTAAAGQGAASSDAVIKAKYARFLCACYIGLAQVQNTHRRSYVHRNPPGLTPHTYACIHTPHTQGHHRRGRRGQTAAGGGPGGVPHRDGVRAGGERVQRGLRPTDF